MFLGDTGGRRLTLSFNTAKISRNLVEHIDKPVATMATVYPADHPTLPGKSSPSLSCSA